VLKQRLLHRRFRSRGPWRTRFQIDGEGYGGYIDFTGDHRVNDFAERVPPGRVLELGCLEGGQTVELARRGYSVTGIEGRAENAERARWVLRLLDIDAEVIEANLETTPLRRFGRFDAIFCSGLLYHLPEPWKLLAQFREVVPVAFVSTHYAKAPTVTVEGRQGDWYGEYGRADALSGLSARSFWFTLDALVEECRRQGFCVEVIRDEQTKNGPLVSLGLA
jgi:SAM-dependent methyltransferase